MLQIEKIRPWNAECEVGLCYAMGAEREAIVAGVDAGTLECYRLWGGEAYMVTRTENGVLTCVSYQGARLLEATQLIWQRLQPLGVREVRFHTRRPAIARLLKQFRFRPVEHVFAAPLQAVH